MEVCGRQTVIHEGCISVAETGSLGEVTARVGSEGLLWMLTLLVQASQRTQRIEGEGEEPAHSVLPVRKMGQTLCRNLILRRVRHSCLSLSLSVPGKRMPSASRLHRDRALKGRGVTRVQRQVGGSDVVTSSQGDLELEVIPRTSCIFVKITY